MNTNNLFRQIPKVDELLAHPLLAHLPPAPSLTDSVRTVLDKLRRDIGNGLADLPCLEFLAREAVALFEKSQRPSLRLVINGAGVILHTNLGRAPLAEEALDAVSEAARGYSTLEYNIEEGQRSSRHVHVEDLLTRLTWAEAAMAVNNNAAAVLLALSAVAAGREVIVSRGELVEIGGSFRVPDVMLQSGCRLVEVGTTNKTNTKDYENAVDPERTGALLRVHRSNFTMTGFVSQPSLEELSAIGKRHNVPVIDDLGSGCLIQLAPYGIYGQPVVADSVKAGIDIVTFSGDKLLGGPQAGLIAGRAEHIAKMKAHPLARAMRIDKLCLAALEATLRLYLCPEAAVRKIPTLRMLCATPDELLEKARALQEIIEQNCGAIVRSQGAECCVVTENSQAGGGAMPEENLSSAAVAISLPGMSAREVERRFRMADVPIIGRVSRDRFLLDMRTISIEDFPLIAERCKL